MDFLKSLTAISVWLLRLSLAAVVLFMGWLEVVGFDLGSRGFWIALAGMLFALLFLAGGFAGKPGWTRTGAIAVFALFVYLTWESWPVFPGTLWNILGMSAALYFAAGGNKN